MPDGALGPVDRARAGTFGAVPLRCNPSIVECMTTKTIGFAVAEEDEARLERLAQRFGSGNR